MRDFQMPGRSTVHSANGMAATSHPASTLAAIDTLRAGGNAIDAAVTAAAVQAVVEPHSTGIGGDCFVLVSLQGSDNVIALNGSGRAPFAAIPEWFVDAGISQIPLESPHAVTVPGAVDAWARLISDYGTKTFGEILRPAIDYAENGYVVQPRAARDWPGYVEKLANDRTAKQIFLPCGRAPMHGEVIRQPLLAETFRTVSREGRKGFYEGPVAEDIVRYLQTLGGLHTLEDFVSHASEYVSPIKTSYRGNDVYECPPNSQGVAVLIMLGILEGFDLGAFEPLGVDRLHLQAEATRLAYHVCDSLIGDPHLVDVPVDDVLEEENIECLRSRICMDSMMTDIPVTAPTHPETVYLTVVDKQRNAVSLINSVCFGFGSGLVSPNTGVVLHNRGAGFLIKPGHPNAIGPAKRPRHTIIPSLVLKDGRPILPFGVMGGQFQPVGQVHVLTNFLDFGMDLQESIDLARGFHFAGVYRLERGIRDEVAERLRERGHKIERVDAPWGSAQAICIDWQNQTLIGASDPRKDSLALGY